MQSSRGPPPHGSTPSPTDRSNTHTAVPGSFHSSESVPSSSHFFAMDPLTDQRLTGPPSMMPYHSLSQYVHACALSDNIAVDADGSVALLTAHPPTKILYRGRTPRHGIPRCSTPQLLQSIHPPPHYNLTVWSLRATRATHLYRPYPRELYHLAITFLPLLKRETV